MLRYVPAGLGDKLGAWPQSRSAGWRIWVLAVRGACRKAAWRSWPSSSGVWQGGSGGHGIRLVLLALRAPSERRSAPALPSPSRLLPPLSPTCFFTHLTSSLPGRARARAGVHTRPGLAGAAREARRDRRSRRATRSLMRPPPPLHLYPGLAGPLPVRPAPPGSSLLDFTDSSSFLLDFFAQSPKPLSCPSSNCLDRRAEGQTQAERGAGILPHPDLPTPPPPHTHTQNQSNCRQTDPFQGSLEPKPEPPPKSCTPAHREEGLPSSETSLG